MFTTGLFFAGNFANDFRIEIHIFVSPLSFHDIIIHITKLSLIVSPSFLNRLFLCVTSAEHIK